MINKDHVRSKFTIHIIKCEYNEIYPRGLSKKLPILNVIIFFTGSVSVCLPYAFRFRQVAT
jgi:hypothetical protein